MGETSTYGLLWNHRAKILVGLSEGDARCCAPWGTPLATSRGAGRTQSRPRSGSSSGRVEATCANSQGARTFRAARRWSRVKSAGVVRAAPSTQTKMLPSGSVAAGFAGAACSLTASEAARATDSHDGDTRGANIQASPRQGHGESTMQIGWIGTGVMGASMAGHLLRAGHTLTVFTRTRAAHSPCWTRAPRGLTPHAISLAERRRLLDGRLSERCRRGGCPGLASAPPATRAQSPARRDADGHAQRRRWTAFPHPSSPGEWSPYAVAGRSVGTVPFARLCRCRVGRLARADSRALPEERPLLSRAHGLGDIVIGERPIGIRGCAGSHMV